MKKDWIEHWLKFGFKLVPCKDKIPLVTFKDIRELITPEISRNWFKSCTNANMIGGLTDDNLIVLDADSEESIDALRSLESDFSQIPKLVVKTKRGEHHYFRLPNGINGSSRGYGKDKPKNIDIKTGRSIIMLPFDNQYIIDKSLPEIDHMSELSEISLPFLEAVYRHNGDSYPLKTKPSAQLQSNQRWDGSDCEIENIRELLNNIPPDLDYSDWTKILAGVSDFFDGSDLAVELCDEWSRQGEKYKGRNEIEYKVNSFTPGTGCTIGTVRYFASLYGKNIQPVKNNYMPSALGIFDAVPSAKHQVIDYSSPLIFTKKSSNRPLKTLENLEEIISRLGVEVRYNVIRKDAEMTIPNQSFTTDNENSASRAWLKSECAKFDYPPDAVDLFLTNIADRNKYNPVADWIDSKVWDGIDRLTEFCETIQTFGNTELKNTLITKWLISCIAVAYNPKGASLQGMLVLQGKQGLGKTVWFKKLVPEHRKLTKDGFLLQPHDKDSILQACSYWLVELGELDATFRKADIAALKAFITQDTDTVRIPYDRRESTFARRTAFFASVNPIEFLRDDTGNRRFWTIACSDINSQHKIDMQQLWAQVHELYNSGFTYHLTEDELCQLNNQNEFYQETCPLEEELLSAFDWEQPKEAWDWMKGKEIFRAIGIDKPNKADYRKITPAINKFNNTEVKKDRTGTKIYLMPTIKTPTFPSIAGIAGGMQV